MDQTRLLDIFRAFQKFEVDYAIFGAIALGLHGLARATADLDVFLAPNRENIERLKAALKTVFDDPSIDDISVDELCGDYPAVRYWPPEGFGLDLLTRLGEAVLFDDLDIEEKDFEGVPVWVVTARTLWALKKDTVRPADRIDAGALADKFGFDED